MTSFDPENLAAWTGGRWSRPPSASPTGFSVDSRRIGPGQVFVALKTSKRDGHDFLVDARSAGACAAVVSREVAGVDLPQLVVADPLAALQAIARSHRKTFTGSVIGITGSAGKTSTKELLAVLLGGRDAGVMATEGNLNNQIGVALTLCRLDPSRDRFAVVEAGISAPGEMITLAAMIEPDIAIVTMVGPAHLAELGDIESVAREKAVLAASVRRGGVSIFPSSCEAYAAFRELPSASCLVVQPASGPDERAPARGRIVFSASHERDSTTIPVAYGPPPPVVVKLRRVTDGMSQNAAMAVCAAMRLGIPRKEIERRLAAWSPAPLRGEWRISDGRRLYLDCYNANPASMSDALASFNAVAPSEEPRLLVIGCMEELGTDARRYHVELGRSLRLRPGDQLAAIGGLADSIRQGAIEAGADARQIEVSDTVGPISARLSAFRGSVFVKGSRRHQLELAFAGPEYAEAPHA
jgi:UDP-N-acetylmuramoyl-tripeptide--D-alanyl-D-alanine ligase